MVAAEVVEQPVAVASALVAVLSPYFQMLAEHVHVFANLTLALASVVVAGNKYPLAKAAFAAVALALASVLALAPGPA